MLKRHFTIVNPKSKVLKKEEYTEYMKIRLFLTYILQSSTCMDLPWLIKPIIHNRWLSVPWILFHISPFPTLAPRREM